MRSRPKIKQTSLREETGSREGSTLSRLRATGVNCGWIIYVPDPATMKSKGHLKMKHNLTLSTHMRVGKQMREIRPLSLYLVQIILSGRYAGKKGKQLAKQAFKVEAALNDFINSLHKTFLKDYRARNESIPQSPYCNAKFWLANPQKTGGSLYTTRNGKETRNRDNAKKR